MVTSNNHVMKSSFFFAGLIIFLLASLFISCSAQSGGSCGNGWYAFRDKCYKVYEYTKAKDRIAGDVARENCRKQGGQLASIHSKEENDFIASIGNQHRWILIGLNYNVSKQTYAWQDGSPYDFKHWRQGEPNGQSRNEICTEIIKDPYPEIDGRWNDISCSNKVSYVCQKKNNNLDFEKCLPSEGGGFKFRDSCYTVVNTEMSWQDAEQYCQESYINGHLLKILDVSHNTYLNYILQNSTEPLWIGIKTKRGFQQHWSSNWPVAYENLSKDFKDIQPDRCILRQNKTTWTDADCNEKRKFICEESTVKPPVLIPPRQPSRCPESPSNLWDFGGEYCYYIDMESYITWYDAQYTCLQMGGSLASIHSPQLEQYFHYFIKNKQRHIHIGLSNLLTNRQAFSWSDGSNLDYENWAIGQPDLSRQYPPEDCVDVFTIDNKWHDYECDKQVGYICQVAKVPLRSVVQDENDCKRTCWLLRFGVSLTLTKDTDDHNHIHVEPDTDHDDHLHIHGEPHTHKEE